MIIFQLDAHNSYLFIYNTFIKIKLVINQGYTAMRGQPIIKNYCGVIMYSCFFNAGMSKRVWPVLFIWRPVELFEATYEKGPKVTVCK